MRTALLRRKSAGRAPGVPPRLACLFNRPIGQTPRPHEVQDTAAQGPAQPGPGRQRPPTAVTAHRTRAGTQERSDHRGVAGVGGQEECHLRLVAGREPRGQLGLLLRVEEGIVALAARRLPAVPGDARRADVHDFRSLPGAICGQRAAGGAVPHAAGDRASRASPGLVPTGCPHGAQVGVRVTPVPLWRDDEVAVRQRWPCVQPSYVCGVTRVRDCESRSAGARERSGPRAGGVACAAGSFSAAADHQFHGGSGPGCVRPSLVRRERPSRAVGESAAAVDGQAVNPLVS